MEQNQPNPQPNAENASAPIKPADQPPAPSTPPSNQPGGKKDRKSFAIAGLILGIVGVLTSGIIFIGLPVAVVGLILSIMSLKSSKRGMAIAGVILCVIALVFVVLGLFVLGSFLSSYNQGELMQMMESQQ